MNDDSTGLNLFDETASAVGNFPTALRGYDRTAVDEYVRSLELRVVQASRAAREQADRSPAGPGRHRAGSDVDLADVGERAREILALAEQQAREVLAEANKEAEQIKQAGRAEADASLGEAARRPAVAADASEEIRALHARNQQMVQAQVERAKADAAAILAAARREAESVRREADHAAETVRQTAYLDAEEQRRAAHAEAAQIRAGVAEERQNALSALRDQHTESVQATGALLAEATQHHREAGERVAADIEAAARIRAEAESEAQAIVLQATRQAEEREAAAHRRADAILSRTQVEFDKRRETLRQETEQLSARKKAVLSQLAALSELANETSAEVPELQPLADLSDDLEQYDDRAAARVEPSEEAHAIVTDATRAVNDAGHGPEADRPA